MDCADRLVARVYRTEIEYLPWAFENRLGERLRHYPAEWSKLDLTVPHDEGDPVKAERILGLDPVRIIYARAAKTTPFKVAFDPETPEGVQRLLDDRASVTERIKVGLAGWSPFAQAALRGSRVFESHWGLPERPADRGLISRYCRDWPRVRADTSAEVVADVVADFAIAAHIHR